MGGVLTAGGRCTGRAGSSLAQDHDISRMRLRFIAGMTQGCAAVPERA